MLAWALNHEYRFEWWKGDRRDSRPLFFALKRYCILVCTPSGVIVCIDCLLCIAYTLILLYVKQTLVHRIHSQRKSLPVQTSSQISASIRNLARTIRVKSSSDTVCTCQNVSVHHTKGQGAIVVRCMVYVCYQLLYVLVSEESLPRTFKESAAARENGEDHPPASYEWRLSPLFQFPDRLAVLNRSSAACVERRSVWKSGQISGMTLSGDKKRKARQGVVMRKSGAIM
jgi:hypothetical protein